MRTRLSTVCAIATAFVLSCCGCAASGYTVFPATPVFSDGIMFSASILGGRAEYAYERMLGVLGDIDRQVSLTREDSDLAVFNGAAAGERVEVGEHLYKLFGLGVEYYALTDGAFNIAAAPLVSLWNADAKSLAAIKNGTLIPALPERAEVESTRAFCDPRLVSAEHDGGKYYLTKSDGRVKLDFGGLAKGYAADMCAAVLDEYSISSALIDISGNAYFYGDYAGSAGPDWHVGVMSPRPRETFSRGYVCAVSVQKDSSAVTSGDYNRYYVTSGKEPVYVTHVISPDGVPVGVEWDEKKGEWTNSPEWVISATVFAKSSALCDALSTAAMALGLEAGGALLKKQAVKGLIFTEERYTIINDVRLYKPDDANYAGYREYAYYEL